MMAKRSEEEKLKKKNEGEAVCAVPQVQHFETVVPKARTEEAWLTMALAAAEKVQMSGKAKGRLISAILRESRHGHLGSCSSS